MELALLGAAMFYLIWRFKLMGEPQPGDYEGKHDSWSDLA